jgi:hypothetical protein
MDWRYPTPRPVMVEDHCGKGEFAENVVPFAKNMLETFGYFVVFPSLLP